MEIYQLQYFLSIAQKGSFTKASAALYVSQPSISAGIKKLEQELGVSLLERRWRGVGLTEAGELFLIKAQKILSEHQSIIDTLRNFQSRPVLRIGVLCTLYIGTILKVVQSFRELYPEVTVELHDTHFENLSDWLDNGEVDVAITNLMDSADKKTAHLLFQQRLVLGVPSDHAWAEKKEIRLTELEGQPFIERIKCEVIAKKSPPIFEAAGVKPYIVYRADHEEWVVALIQAGMGMSIMPKWDDIEGIAYVPIAEMQPVRAIGLLWNEHKSFELTDLFCSFAAQGIWFDRKF